MKPTGNRGLVETYLSGVLGLPLSHAVVDVLPIPQHLGLLLRIHAVRHTELLYGGHALRRTNVPRERSRRWHRCRAMLLERRNPLSNQLFGIQYCCRKTSYMYLTLV